MSEVSQGAGQQVQQLRAVDETLQTIRDRAAGVHEQAVVVSALAEQIETVAGAKRSDIDRALAILVDVKTAVERAATEVRELHATAAEIARTAESNAAAAEQVSASTQEQSAACEEMTTASSMLLEGSTRLKEIVGAIRTAA